jgi:ribulose-phosphate 3-epimerase
MKKLNINQVIIAPSILSAPAGELLKTALELEQVGADWLHLDVMDGSFVPPITFGDALVSDLKKKIRIPLDVHLMINHPECHIERFVKAGADFVTVHYEACITGHLHRVLSEIKQLGAKAGIAINPATPVSGLYEILEIADLFLIMSVNPGWGGQSYIDSVTRKISDLREQLTLAKLSTMIEVDGGIDPSTAKLAITAGANILVSGSYITHSKNWSQAIKSLKQSL